VGNEPEAGILVSRAAVDATGNESGDTDWIRGLSNDNADLIFHIADDFLSSADGVRLTTTSISLESALQNALANNATVDLQGTQYGEFAHKSSVRTTIVLCSLHG
jgi:hypothetical protein